MRWSLKNLYESFNSEEFKADLARVDSRIASLREWCDSELENTDNCVKKIEEYLGFVEEISSVMTKLQSFAELSLSVNSKDEKALQYLEKLYEKKSEMTKPEVLFGKWLIRLGNLESLAEKSGRIMEHLFYLVEKRDKSAHLLSEKEEFVISKMKATGSSAWSTLWNNLTANLLVEITIDNETKTLPLSIVRNLAYDKDVEKRKSAYFAELSAYKKIEESGAAALNSIKGEVLTVSDMRSYSSPLEMTLKNSRMDKETLDAMISAMKEFLPDFRKYLRKKAEILGEQNGLPFYSLFAPIGKSNLTFSYDEAKKFIVENFRSFSSNLADFAEHAFNNSWIDAEPREGKRGGAFCYNLHPIKESRILANFTGSFNDVTTIAHELGHAYHGHCLSDETILNSDYPMPLAETASIFCETIIINAALKKASIEEALSIIESDLQMATQVIVDIYSRYLFETALFEKRKNGSLSVSELKETMLNAQKEAYGDGLSAEALHPYMWLNKPHYYDADYNFYNFPYAFGLLFAKGLYAEYLKTGSKFVEKYDMLLSATGKNSISAVTKMAGIDVKSTNFWKNSLEIIKEEIDKFISLNN